MKRIILILICMAFTVTLFGCGTIKGIGDDLSALGRGIAKASDKVKEGVKKNDDTN